MTGVVSEMTGTESETAGVWSVLTEEVSKRAGGVYGATWDSFALLGMASVSAGMTGVSAGTADFSSNMEGVSFIAMGVPSKTTGVEGWRQGAQRRNAATGTSAATANALRRMAVARRILWPICDQPSGHGAISSERHRSRTASIQSLFILLSIPDTNSLIIELLRRPRHPHAPSGTGGCPPSTAPAPGSDWQKNCFP